MKLPTSIGDRDVYEVDEWSDPAPEPLCPAVRADPEKCDCGYTGRWEHRWVYGWHRPRRRRGSYGAAATANGWKVFIGYDERCPGCHDIERFDLDAERVGWQRGTAAPVRVLHP